MTRSQREFDDAVEAARVAAARADDLLSQARAEKDPQFAAMVPEFRYNTATAFVNNYVEGGLFPLERLYDCTGRMIDVLLERAYIHLDLGLTNVFVVDRSARSPSSARLAEMALAQSIIGRSRIAWERIFQLIHVLETGNVIEGKSTKKKFFKFVDEHPRWYFMEVYKECIEKFDETLRGPEYHKNSTLRARFLAEQPLDYAELIAPSNLAEPIPKNINAILKSGWNDSFTDLHCEGGGVDAPGRVKARYWPPSYAG